MDLVEHVGNDKIVASLFARYLSRGEVPRKKPAIVTSKLQLARAIFRK